MDNTAPVVHAYNGMTKADQLAYLRTVEALLNLLPDETRARLLWEAAHAYGKRAQYPSINISWALWGTCTAVKNAREARPEITRCEGVER